MNKLPFDLRRFPAGGSERAKQAWRAEYDRWWRSARRADWKHRKAYRTWFNLRYRCYHKKDRSFRYYGARGITVAARWWSFAAFLADMGLPRRRDHSIERLDNDKGYTPKNCKWATLRQQLKHRRKQRGVYRCTICGKPGNRATHPDHPRKKHRVRRQNYLRYGHVAKPTWKGKGRKK